VQVHPQLLEQLHAAVEAAARDAVLATLGPDRALALLLTDSRVLDLALLDTMLKLAATSVVLRANPAAGAEHLKEVFGGKFTELLDAGLSGRPAEPPAPTHAAPVRVM
jgi:hypothetical protein